MRFREPTDTKILVCLYYFGGATVKVTAGMVERVNDYVGDRLSDLAYYGYTKRPMEQQGFYQLTQQGATRVENLDEQIEPRDLEKVKAYIPELLDRAELEYVVSWGDSEVRHPEWFDG